MEACRRCVIRIPANKSVGASLRRWSIENQLQRLAVGDRILGRRDKCRGGTEGVEHRGIAGYGCGRKDRGAEVAAWIRPWNVHGAVVFDSVPRHAETLALVPQEVPIALHHSDRVGE